MKELEEGPRPAPTAQALLEAHEAAKAAQEAQGPVVTALMAFLQQKYAGGAGGGGGAVSGRRGSGARGAARHSGSGRRDHRLPTVDEVRSGGSVTFASSGVT